VAVAVKVHQLGTKADASARGDAAVLVAILELDAGAESGPGNGTLVAIDPEQAFLELANEQVGHAVAVEVADERSGVAHLGVNGFTC
jgi:hypothetical protein